MFGAIVDIFCSLWAPDSSFRHYFYGPYEQTESKGGVAKFYAPSVRVTGLEERKRKTSTPVKGFSRLETEWKSPLM